MLQQFMTQLINYSNINPINILIYYPINIIITKWNNTFIEDYVYRENIELYNKYEHKCKTSFS